MTQELTPGERATVGPRDLSAFEFQLYQWHPLNGAAA